MRDSTTTRRAAICALVAMLAACSRPEAPDKDQPPEPTASAASTAAATPRPPNVILDAYQPAIDRAKGVEDEVKEAAEEQKAAIEAAGG